MYATAHSEDGRLRKYQARAPHGLLEDASNGIDRDCVADQLTCLPGADIDGIRRAILMLEPHAA